MRARRVFIRFYGLILTLLLWTKPLFFSSVVAWSQSPSIRSISRRSPFFNGVTTAALANGRSWKVAPPSGPRTMPCIFCGAGMGDGIDVGDGVGCGVGVGVG